MEFWVGVTGTLSRAARRLRRYIATYRRDTSACCRPQTCTTGAAGLLPNTYPCRSSLRVSCEESQLRHHMGCSGSSGVLCRGGCRGATHKLCNPAPRANNSLDATTEVFIMAEDKVLEMYASETDDSSSKKRDKNQNLSTSKLSPSHGLMATPEHSSAVPLHGSSLLGGELPVRGTQFPLPMVPTMVHDQHGFTEGNGLSMAAPSSTHTHTSGNGALSLDVGVSATHSSGRRPSIFSPASADYPAQGWAGLYAQQWQTGSATPHSPAVYSFSQQRVSQSPTTYVDTAVSMGQSQSYLGTSFDGLPRAYEAPHSSMFRTGAVSQ